MEYTWKSQHEAHQHGAIMILTRSFALPVTIAESGSIQLAITLEKETHQSTQEERLGVSAGTFSVGLHFEDSPVKTAGVWIGPPSFWLAHICFSLSVRSMHVGGVAVTQ